ncbi:type I polyketide synthase [Enhygromyxa salina]|uniref:Phthiocerol/phenolphthiocerol synthesis polyketide synthase type I PpsA n=1 Tax=Enhygromyxa salina TaxID=215803 RepID=A0A2S9YVJ4_9BACT|nr:type I polyketide synthase [Enhygromyxa salina]PRQ09072.1 Phthiocerol/phenolphthiocerol synthesis polyketide synthase type I PpsA [Enhygromyxa salina]
MTDAVETPGTHSLSPAKQELLRRLRASAGPRRLADDPIAVIGLALRVPGAPDQAGYWQLLANSVDAIEQVPASRWSIGDYHHPDPNRRGSIASRYGGFLDQIDQFDAELFGISPREAATLDPQHRLLLEQSWVAIEDAGLRRDLLEGSATGVFLASYQRDYAKLATRDRFAIDAYTASGTHHSMAAGRLAYLLDLRGPALVVDTACSSSLVALHLGCRSLLSGESSRALVGASNLMLAPEESIALSRWGMLASDGRCKPFDARADGFVRGEGVVVLVLARLADAVAQGHRVRALILGTAVNQDGHSNGLTAPNAAAQRALIRAALRDAELEPGQIGYVEAHGTGTALGDPIEMQAIVSEYGAASRSAPVCAVGSVKSNIGHLEAAAGLAGVAKAIACLEHRQIPASLHLETLNPAMDLDGARVEIASRHREWDSDGPRHAAVSSFGMGGTNAHVILAEAPAPAELAPRERSGFVLPLSAHNGPALRALIHATGEALARAPDLHEYCASAARARTHHPQHRVAVAGVSATALRVALAERVETLPATTQAIRRGVVFVCPGQGGQWLGMGRCLLEREPAFAAQLELCDAVIRPLAGWSVIDTLRAPGLDLERVEVVQPMLFALSLGLAAVWRGFGVQPDAVIGHSMGEVAAAHLAGRLSLEDAARVIVRRSALMRALPAVGAMVAIDLPAVELARRIELAGPGSQSLAADNAPSAAVLSGPLAAVDAMVAELEAGGVRCRRIAVGVASHSPAVDGSSEQLLGALAGVGASPPAGAGVALYSTLEGRLLGPDTPMDAEYWRRNLREPVRFWPAVQAAVADEHHTFIELGPHPVLLPAVREGLDALGVRGLLVGSGRRDCDEQVELNSGLAALYEAGATLDWDRVYAGARTHAALPSYPFQRRSHWLPQPRTSVSAGAHPLLGEPIELARGSQPAAPSRVFTSRVTLDHAPFLRDHLVEGSCVLPGMGSVDLVLSALAQQGRSIHELRDVEFERPIVFGEGEPLVLQLRLDAERSTTLEFEIWARTEAEREWTRRVHGWAVELRERGPAVELESLRARCRPSMTGPGFYAWLNQTGNIWGPSFAGVAAVARDGDDLLVDLEIPRPIADELSRHCFHPALLDACGQALLRGADRDRGSFVLAKIDRIALYGPAEQVHASWIHVDNQQRRGSLRGDVVVVDTDGAPIVEIEGLRIQYLHEQQSSWYHALAWRPAVKTEPTYAGRRFALVGAAADLRRELSQCLTARGVEQVDLPDATDIVHFAPSPDRGASSSDRSAEATLEGATRACEGALLSQGSLRPDQRLWLVTQAAAPSLAGLVDPMISAVWGLGRVMQIEGGLRFARSVDLDHAAGLVDMAALLADELGADDRETEVAYRAGQRLVARLEQRPPASASGRVSPLNRLDPGGSYVITGGLGGLGLRMAGHLLEHGARRLILLGRTGLPPRARWHELAAGTRAHAQVAAVRALEARGAEVHVVALNVADEPSLRAWAEQWTREQRPAIRGLVHAAGVQLPGALAELSADQLRDSLQAKLAGACALARVFHDPLEFFLLFSSAATLLPSPLLGAYTAANAFLDGFATLARAAGRPVTAVSWGLLGAGDMASQHLAQRGQLDGFEDMDPAAAYAALERPLAAELGHVGVMAIDWPAWLARHAALAQLPYFESLTRAGEAKSSPLAGASDSLVALRSADAAARRELLGVYLREQLGRVLQIPRAALDSIDPDAALTRLGIDSLMALELRNRVEAETGAAPAVVELLRGISLARLIELVDAQLDARAAQPSECDWEELTI